jgi:hypothetical protein
MRPGAHVPAKPALGLEPRVDAGARIRICGPAGGGVYGEPFERSRMVSALRSTIGA